MIPRCCPWCDRPLSGSCVAEWRGLRVVWFPPEVSWQGKPLAVPTLIQLQFLHVLVSAAGRPARCGQLDALTGPGTGEKNRQVQMVYLRRWLRRHGLPFTVPRADQRVGYLLRFES